MSFSNLYGNSPDLLELLLSDEDTIKKHIASCTNPDELKKLLNYITNQADEECVDEAESKKLKQNIALIKALLGYEVLMADISQSGAGTNVSL